MLVHEEISGHGAKTIFKISKSEILEWLTPSLRLHVYLTISKKAIICIRKPREKKSSAFN